MTTPSVATNAVQRAQSHLRTHAGVAVNTSIPVGGIEPWRTERIQKVCGFGGLPANWDGRGSAAPGMAVRAMAIDFLMSVPSSIGAPRIVPVSAGGVHFEWSLDGRELEVSVDENCRFEALYVENGVPLDEDPPMDMQAWFAWLTSR